MKTKQKIDWEKAERHLHEVMPNLEKDLAREFAFLETVEPSLELERYSPRISVQFMPKGKRSEEREMLFQSLPQYKKELKERQEKISSIISKIADRYGLEAISGIIHVHYGGRKKMSLYTHELGEYTIRPFYKEFIVN